jgi:hypothetical protein
MRVGLAHRERAKARHGAEHEHAAAFADLRREARDARRRAGGDGAIASPHGSCSRATRAVSSHAPTPDGDRRNARAAIIPRSFL